MRRPASSSSASLRLSRLLHVFVGGPLALWCGVLLLLAPGAAQAAEVSASTQGCIDLELMLLAGTMTPADPSLLVSAAHAAAAAAHGEGEDPLFLHGMSCDGPSSCSPWLVGSSAESDGRAPSRRDEPVRGPMCSTSNPEACNLSSGSAPGLPQLDLGLSLVPFLSRREPMPARPDDEAGADPCVDALRHARDQALCPRSVVRRLERPPRA